MTKPGRPKKRNAEKHRNPITPRFTDEELARIEAIVEPKGITPATWLRMLALGSLCLLMACSNAPAATPGVDSDADLAPVSGDLAEVQTDDMTHAANADMAHAMPQPDLAQAPDLAPVACVATSSPCQVDAQCCSNSGAAGSCFFGSSSGIANCCKPHGHLCTAGDTIYSCCPGSQCIVTSGQNGTCG